MRVTATALLGLISHVIHFYYSVITHQPYEGLPLHWWDDLAMGITAVSPVSNNTVGTY